MNGSIGVASTVVSFIPVIGLGLESYRAFSGRMLDYGTTFAAMAVLDVTGVGEVGSLTLKGALMVTAKIGGHAAIRMGERGVTENGTNGTE